jgi:glycogen synthase/ankyrin repeat protein
MAKSIMTMMAEIQASQPIEEHKEPPKNQSIFIKLLHVSMEYGMPGIPGSIAVGGIGSVVYSLCNAQKVHEDFIDVRVIIPYYEGLHKNLLDFEEVCEIKHFYDEKFVRSMILKKMTNEGVIQYLVKPLEMVGIQLFNDIHIPELIYSDGWNGSKFIHRIAYFSSAVSEFACSGEPLFKPSIIQGHGWALSFLGKLIREKRKEKLEEKPYTVYVAHSIHDGDGVFSSKDIPIFQKKVAEEKQVRLTSEIIENGYDHIVYVSEQLLKESILNPNYETISNFVFDAYKSAKASAILNNISTERFDPSKCLPDEFKFDLNEIHSGKEKIKIHLNNGLLKERGKAINLYAPMVLYVGRYSYEKGIEIFDSAIQLILKNKGTFFSMGTGDPSLIQWLIDKYENEKSVIFFTTKEEQAIHGTLVRSAADILLTPSKIETCGLTPPEGNVSGTIAVASRVGGLVNIIVPDANGALFEFDNNFEEVLQNVFNSYLELKRTGNLNITLQLIQESAVKTFDWNSKYNGSNFSYFNLYCRLGNEEEMKKKLIEQETVFTHALITNNEEVIQSILKTNDPRFFYPNKIGLTPHELALRMDRHDIAKKIHEIIYQKIENPPSQKKLIYRKKRIILNVCLEYKQTKLGGVGIFVTSFVDAINAYEHSNTECQVIIPHYPWHDELISKGLIKKKNEYEIIHLYEDKMIKSIVTKVKNDDVIQYLIKPELELLYEPLYKAITKNEANKIFENLGPKTAYFNSAVSAFISQSKLKFNILIAHGSGCALTAKLLKEREKFHHIKSIQVVHAEITEQGVITNDDPHFKYLQGIGIQFNDEYHISPLKEGVIYSDKTMFVSESLMNQTMGYFGHFHFNEIIREKKKSGKLTAILNGINDHFHPEKIFSTYKDLKETNKISENKLIAKHKVSELISSSINSNTCSLTEKEFFDGKILDCTKVWTIFIGRFSEEKGIDRLGHAIEFTLNNNGIFVIMGLYGGRKEDLIIQHLSEKYSKNPNVIIIHEKNYNCQKKYGPLFRFAGDILFIPSHKESAGLLVLEGLLNSQYIISSDVGGLNDSVIPYKTGLKYHDLDPYPYESMRKTIDEANNLILNLKKHESDNHEKLLQSLYEKCIRKHLFYGPEGPIKRYMELFDSLCYLPLPHESIIPSTDLTKYPTEKSIEEKIINTGISIYTKSKDEIEIYKKNEGYENSFQNNHDNNLFIGKVIRSVKNIDAIGKLVYIKQKNISQLTNHQTAEIMNEFDVLHKLDYLELPNPHISDNGDVYFFIKWNEYNSFYNILPKSSEIEFSKKLLYVERLMKSLKKIHDKNILHLNINEESIILEEKISSEKFYLNAKIINFNSSKIIDRKKNLDMIDYFTENSPTESLEGLYSEATDIYGLGLFIFKYLFNPTKEYLSKKNPILGIRSDLKHIMISNFETGSQLTNKQSYVILEIKKMIEKMVGSNDKARPTLDECIAKIIEINKILLYPNLYPEFSLPEYYSMFGFRSFDIENPRILEVACKNNYFEVVKKILSNIDQKNNLLSNSNNLELLTEVVKFSDLHIIKILLLHGFFNWVTLDGIIEFINTIDETMTEKKDILGLFRVYFFSKNHGFNLENLREYNHEGYTPLSKLILTDDWTGESDFLVNQLTIHGANINQKTSYGFDLFYLLNNNKKIKNPLQAFLSLIRNGFIILDEHLNYKENLNNHFYIQLNALYFIQANNISGNKPNSKCFDSEHTALTLAAKHGDDLSIGYLLDFYMQEHKQCNKSIILNHRNRLGKTALHTAISEGKFSTAYFLIENGADIHLKDLHGNTAIDLIKKHHHETDAQNFLSAINKYFQKKYYSINIWNVSDKLLYYFKEKNFSAIYLSSLNNALKLPEVIKNRFLKSVFLNNPKKEEIIQLVEMGFNLYHRDESSKSFLTWAQQEDPRLTEKLHLYEIDFLNQQRFNLDDINDVNESGHTPLSYAVFIQDINLIQSFLMNFNAEINAKNIVGNTALHLSVDTRNLAIIKLLLSHGGDIDSINYQGLSPQDLAFGNEFHEVIELFEQTKKSPLTHAQVKIKI